MLKVKDFGELFYIHWKSNSTDILDPKLPQNVKMMKIKFVDYIFFSRPSLPARNQLHQHFKKKAIRI